MALVGRRGFRGAQHRTDAPVRRSHPVWLKFGHTLAFLQPNSFVDPEFDDAWYSEGSDFGGS
jgi:hypothetical protein